MTSPPSTDAALWEFRPAFGVAGGPDEVVLTAEGMGRAFSVGARVRRGGPAEALLCLADGGGAGYLSCRGEGARVRRTELGRFDQIVWGHLRSLSYVMSFQDAGGDGVRLTEAGRVAVQRGVDERVSLLGRCRAVASAMNGGR